MKQFSIVTICIYVLLVLVAISLNDFQNKSAKKQKKKRQNRHNDNVHGQVYVFKAMHTVCRSTIKMNEHIKDH